jgi:hypothetical protein
MSQLNPLPPEHKPEIPPIISAKLKTVPELLQDGAALYAERNKQYGDNYKLNGAMMQLLFPNGIPPQDAEGWNAFGVWFMVFTKAQRYAQGFTIGERHNDTAKDIKVYGAMLEELTQ